MLQLTSHTARTGILNFLNDIMGWFHGLTIVLPDGPMMAAEDRDKIYCDKEAKNQLTTMKAKSLNKNPPVWEQSFNKSLKISSLNVHSLRDKIDDIRSDPILQFSDIIILSETWLDIDVDEKDPSLQIEGYKLHLNSVGRGKGLAVYYKDKIVAIGHTDNDTNQQITIMESRECCIMGLYRSAGDTTLSNCLRTMIPKVGPFMVTGDFNICLAKKPDHEVFQRRSWVLLHWRKKVSHIVMSTFMILPTLCLASTSW